MYETDGDKTENEETDHEELPWIILNVFLICLNLILFGYMLVKHPGSQFTSLLGHADLINLVFSHNDQDNVK